MISVIVPHYNDLVGLDRCLSSLDGQSMPRDRFEVIVADNESPCGEDAVAATIAGRARLVIATQRGAGPARNAGVAASSGDILAFLDSDCVATPNWLEEGVAALAHYGYVGGRIDVLVDEGRALSGAEAFERVFAFDNRAYAEQKRFVVTANLFCLRTTFDSVGPFLNGVSEDMEWCHRANGKGFVLGYQDSAAIGHPARRDWAELHKKWQRLNRETFALTVRQPAGRLRWVLRSWLLPLSVIAHTPRVLTSDRLHGLGDRLRALATLARLRLWRMVDAHRLAVTSHGH